MSWLLEKERCIRVVFGEFHGASVRKGLSYFHRSCEAGTMLPAGFVLLLLQGIRAFVIRCPVSHRCLEEDSGKDSPRLKPCDPDSGLQQWLLTEDRLLVNRVTRWCLFAQPLGRILAGPCDRNTAPHRKHTRSTWTCCSGTLLLASNRLDLKLPCWTFPREGDIKGKQRFRRASGDGDYSEEEARDAEGSGLTEEQREYLRWYDRTEDSSSWKYAMLVLSCAALLLGCLLLGLGIKANRNRKTIVRYKAASQMSKVENLESQTQDASPQDEQGISPVVPDLDRVDRLKTGDIVLKWKDGSVSRL